MINKLQELKNKIRVILKLCDVTDINSDWDLFWYLCENDKTNLIEELLSNGFNVNIKNKANTIYKIVIKNENERPKEEKSLKVIKAPNIKMEEDAPSKKAIILSNLSFCIIYFIKSSDLLLLQLNLSKQL